MHPVLIRCLLLLSLVLALPALANEAAIRKALAERMPNLPKIDEVRETPMRGLWEVRVGHDLLYTDATGQFLLQDAQLLDLKAKRNLTQARINVLTQIAFSALPLKDAVVWKRGSGERRVAVFADPNCGYCKQLERTLQEIDDITVYVFVTPILGPDSVEKSRAIVCAKDSSAVWLDWMVRNKAPAAAPAKCDDAVLNRVTQFAQKYRIQGTPAIFFEDGTRVPGALDQAAIEARLKRAEKG